MARRRRPLKRKQKSPPPKSAHCSTESHSKNLDEEQLAIAGEEQSKFDDGVESMTSEPSKRRRTKSPSKFSSPDNGDGVADTGMVSGKRRPIGGRFNLRRRAMQSRLHTGGNTKTSLRYCSVSKARNRIATRRQLLKRCVLLNKKADARSKRAAVRKNDSDDRKPSSDDILGEHNYKCLICNRKCTLNWIRRHISLFHPSDDPDFINKHIMKLGNDNDVPSGKHVEAEEEGDSKNAPSDDAFTCDYCCRSYAVSSSLRRHMKDCKGNNGANNQLGEKKENVGIDEEETEDNEEEEEGKVHKCRHCPKTYVTFSTLRRHMKDCPMSNGNADELDDDKNDRLDEKENGGVDEEDDGGVHKCRYCPKTYATLLSLRRHFKLCKQYASSDTDERVKHEHPDEKENEGEEEEKAYKCKHCPRRYTVFSSLKRHVKDCMGGTTHENPGSGRLDDDGGKKGADNVDEEEGGNLKNGDAEVYVCKYCYGSFTSTLSLEQHVKECNACTIVRNEYVRNDHQSEKYSIKKHGSRELYICANCKKGYASLASLHRHLEECSDNLYIDKGLGTYVNKTFAIDDAYDKMKTEAGEDAYTCKHCRLRFVTVPLMRRHLQYCLAGYETNQMKRKFNDDVEMGNEDGSPTYTCKICANRYATVFAIHRHLKACQSLKRERMCEDDIVPDGQGNFVCKYCSKTYSSFSSVKRHLKNSCEKKCAADEHTYTVAGENGEPVYVCRLCNERFLCTPRGMETHRKVCKVMKTDRNVSSRAGSRYFSETEKTNESIYYVIRENDGQNVHVCLTCGKRYTTISSVMRHHKNKGCNSVKAGRISNSNCYTLERRDETDYYVCTRCNSSHTTLRSIIQHVRCHSSAAGQDNVSAAEVRDQETGGDVDYDETKEKPGGDAGTIVSAAEVRDQEPGGGVDDDETKEKPNGDARMIIVKEEPPDLFYDEYPALTIKEELRDDECSTISDEKKSVVTDDLKSFDNTVATLENISNNILTNEKSNGDYIEAIPVDRSGLIVNGKLLSGCHVLSKNAEGSPTKSGPAEQTIPNNTRRSIRKLLVSNKRNVDKKCQFCSRVFNNESALRRHINRNHYFDYLVPGKRSHHKPRPHKTRNPPTVVKEDGFGNESSTDLSANHVSLDQATGMDTSNSYIHNSCICSYCSVVFPFESALKAHIDACHTDGEIAPENMDVDLANANNNSSSTTYECDICRKRYKLFWLLRRHREAHFKEPEFKCTACNRMFTTKTNLTSHVYFVHTLRGEKSMNGASPSAAKERHDSRFKLVDINELLGMENRNTNDTNMCDNKDDGDTSADTKVGNRRTSYVNDTHAADTNNFDMAHDKEEMSFHICKICNHIFDRESALITHLYTEHINIDKGTSTSAYNCSGCNRKFTTNADLQAHLCSTRSSSIYEKDTKSASLKVKGDNGDSSNSRSDSGSSGNKIGSEAAKPVLKTETGGATTNLGEDNVKTSSVGLPAEDVKFIVTSASIEPPTNTFLNPLANTVNATGRNIKNSVTSVGKKQKEMTVTIDIIDDDVVIGGVAKTNRGQDRLKTLLIKPLSSLEDIKSTAAESSPKMLLDVHAGGGVSDTHERVKSDDSCTERTEAVTVNESAALRACLGQEVHRSVRPLQVRSSAEEPSAVPIDLHFKYTCPICRLVCPSDQDCSAHMLTKHSSLDGNHAVKAGMLHKCNLCGFKCRVEKNLLHHLTERHIALPIRAQTETSWVCKVCKVKFEKRILLEKHKCTKPLNLSTLPSLSTQQPLISADEKMSAATDGPTFVVDEGRPSSGHLCDICEKRFPSVSILRAHMSNTHANNLLYKCKFCPVTKPVEIELAKHMLVHNFVYKVAPRPQLKCHLAGCLAAFESPDELRRHSAAAHAAQARPTFLCAKCGQPFKSESALLAHARSSHRKHLFLCPYCSKEFDDSGNLAEHMNDHLANMLSCVECGKVFKTADELRKHIDSAHP